MAFEPRRVLRLRIPYGDTVALGPGKAALLETIRETGSISAAGRKLGMSYRKAWLLVDQMNHCFVAPLVEASKGGSHGGGAKVTALGEDLLRRYRALEARAWEAIVLEVDALEMLLRRQVSLDP
jgi:molybdate transport system regulatory protein